MAPGMNLFQLLTLVVVLSALFAYVNYQLLKLPMTIGVMAVALVVSLALIGLGKLGFGLEAHARALLQHIDFDRAVLHGMLAFLLFAAALHIKLDDLGEQKLPIALLSTVGVITSTFVVGGVMWALLRYVGLGGFVGVQLRFVDCLLFGALISPTDPIAVIGILKTAGGPKQMETRIAGESLFNDGIGVVVFLAILQIASGGGGVTPVRVITLFLEESVGGTLLGLGVGLLGFQMLKRVNNYHVEVLLTLAIAMGTYALADALHAAHWVATSGPLAVVAAGLLIGNQGRSLAMSPETVRNLDLFWELIDDILNAALFVLIGLELLVMPLSFRHLVAGAVAVPVVLLARFVSVGSTIRLMQLRGRRFEPGVVRVLTWSGLRGGISVALALSLPAHDEPQRQAREVILGLTYPVVVFSILVQGLTVAAFVRRILARHDSKREVPATV